MRERWSGEHKNKNAIRDGKNEEIAKSNKNQMKMIVKLFDYNFLLTI